MKQYFKKALGIFSMITGHMLSTPIFGNGYYGEKNISQQDDGFEVHCWGRKK
jgi:hypothetical protein